MKISVIGAGKTGRGFIGRLLAESNLMANYFDTNHNLISALNKSGGFTVSYFGGRKPPKNIKGNFYMMDDNIALEYLAESEIIFVSVTSKNLPAVAHIIAPILANRSKKYNIFLCENAVQPSIVFRNELNKTLHTSEHIGIIDSAVFCTTVQSDTYPTDIISEDYPSLVYDNSSVLAPLSIADLPQFIAESNFEILMQRKLYTYNASSAIISYLGFLLGIDNFGESANNPVIKTIVLDFYNNINQAIISKYNIKNEDQEAFSKSAYKKFSDLNIVDSNIRNCAQPKRKLAYNDRIAFPLMLLSKLCLDTRSMSITAAAAIRFGEKTSSSWSAEYPSTEISTNIIKLTSIDTPAIIDEIQFYYNKMIHLPLTDYNLLSIYQENTV